MPLFEYSILLNIFSKLRFDFEVGKNTLEIQAMTMVNKIQQNAYSDLKSKMILQKTPQNRISSTIAMQHMHQLFWYQTVRKGANITCAPLTLK